MIGFGRVFFVEDAEEKRKALNIIMAHYGGESCDYPEATLEKTAVVKVEFESLTAKVSEY